MRTRDPFARLASLCLLAAVACGGQGDEEPKGGDDTDTTADTDTPEGDDTDEDEPTFPPGTFQVRVMNLIAADVDVTGTDADGGAFDYTIPGRTMSEYLVFPVGDTTLELGLPEPYHVAPLTGLGEFDRVVVVLGEVAGFQFPLGFREPDPAAGNRALVVGTTGRRLTLDTEAGQIVLPAGEGGEITRHVFEVPNATERLSWYTNYTPFHFSMGRIPQDGVGIIFNSDLSGEGNGAYYFAARSGPVQPMLSDVPMYAYSADGETASATFTARTPLGDVTIASGVAPYSTGALPVALVPADMTEIVVTGGTSEVRGVPPEGAALGSGIVTLHRVDGAGAVGVLWGEPNNRTASDAYITTANFSDRSLRVRCYWGFGPARGYGQTLETTLVAPAVVLAGGGGQTCNLAVAEPPAEAGSDPTHDFTLTRSTFRGYHLSFVAEDAGALWFHFAHRAPGDGNVYMGRAPATAR